MSEQITLQPELSTVILEVDDASIDEVTVNVLSNGDIDLVVQEANGVLTVDASLPDQIALNVQGMGLQGPPGSNFDCPDDLDESSATYFYFGWMDVNGGWYIQRQVRLTAMTTVATIANNSLVINYNSAWVDRANLVYG